MRAFYNEIDQYCCAWLSNLMDAGHITPGVICDKSIEDVYPDELVGFNRVHMFAGIGVWDYALNRAGWGDSEVWTGSAPCQPFSAAGKGAGFDDERHLWPAWHHLIKERRPAVIFGEQVASKAVDAWIDLVHADLEAVDFAIASVPFPSAGVGAPHIRDRNFWVAYASSSGLSQQRRGFIQQKSARQQRSTQGDCVSRMADAAGQRGHGRPADTAREARWSSPEIGGADSGMGNTDSESARRNSGGPHSAKGQVYGASSRDHNGPRHAGNSVLWLGNAKGERRGEARQSGSGPAQRPADAGPADRPGRANGFWADADWLLCRDGKWRPVEPGTFPLVDGSAGRMGRVRADQERLAALVARKDQGSRTGRLKGYGNAINAQAAEAFIRAAM